jgi:hypothetical protein
MTIKLVDIDIQRAFTDINPHVSFSVSNASDSSCFHVSPLLHSGSIPGAAQPIRLFEFKSRFSRAPMLVNGLDLIGALRQSGYPAENLLAQVWASLYRFGETTKIMCLGSYKALLPDKLSAGAPSLPQSAGVRLYIQKAQRKCLC